MVTRPVGVRAIVLWTFFAAMLVAGVVVWCGPATGTPTREAPAQAPDDTRAEVCAVAIATLVRGLDAADEVYLTPAIRDRDGAWIEPEVAARAAARAGRLSGRAVALAPRASAAGEWTRPAGHILLTLADIRIGPGARLAWLEMEVTGDDGVARRLAFSLKREATGWVPLEWGPAENEG